MAAGKRANAAGPYHPGSEAEKLWLAMPPEWTPRQELAKLSVRGNETGSFNSCLKRWLKRGYIEKRRRSRMIQAGTGAVTYVEYRKTGLEYLKPSKGSVAVRRKMSDPRFSMGAAAVRAVLVAMLDYRTPVLDSERPGAATTVRYELEQLLEFAGVDVPQIEDVA
jgi:hypothetical protein